MQLAAPSVSSAPAKPNLLFVFSDQQHGRAVGFVDPFFATPNLDRLAADAFVFENAFCATPQCSPSRAAILTGLYPSRTGVVSNIGSAGTKPLALATIAPSLQAAGYRTAYFGKWHRRPRRARRGDVDAGVPIRRFRGRRRRGEARRRVLADVKSGDNPSRFSVRCATCTTPMTSIRPMRAPATSSRSRCPNRGRRPTSPTAPPRSAISWPTTAAGRS
jgi:hypothetical protein